MHTVGDRIRAQNAARSRKNAAMAISMIALSVALYLLIAAVPAYITGDSRCMFVRCTIEVGR